MQIDGGSECIPQILQTRLFAVLHSRYMGLARVSGCPRVPFFDIAGCNLEERLYSLHNLTTQCRSSVTHQ